jgi:DNA-binding MarR family transcriptional regulator
MRKHSMQPQLMYLHLVPGQGYDARVSVMQPGGASRPGTGRPGRTVESTPAVDPVVTTWRAIAASHAAACAALEHELGHRHGLGVSEFEVLDRLAESDQHKFRAQELADAVHLSQSALSRLIDRLERHGLVERSLCDADRRGIYVMLTGAGRERHAEAAPTHRDVLAGVLATTMAAS